MRVASNSETESVVGMWETERREYINRGNRIDSLLRADVTFLYCRLTLDWTSSHFHLPFCLSASTLFIYQPYRIYMYIASRVRNFTSILEFLSSLDFDSSQPFLFLSVPFFFLFVVRGEIEDATTTRELPISAFVDSNRDEYNGRLIGISYGEHIAVP